MPAQWPLFINNVSTKLASRTLKSYDEMAEFLANEYFNAVKTSQTPYGNIHQSGQKAILEQGFKKAFKKLFESGSPILEDKFLDPNFEDLKENLPIPPINSNIDKDLEKCLKTKNPYTFFEFSVPTALPTISKSYVTEKKTQPVEIPKIKFNGFEGKPPYTFTYSIDDNVQNSITTKSGNSIVIEADQSKTGTFEYKLLKISDSSGTSHSMNVDPIYVDVFSGEYEDLKIIETSTPATPLKETDLLELVIKRILFQNDGTAEFKRWVDRLEHGYNKSFGKKVKTRVNQLLSQGTKSDIEFNIHKFQVSHQDDKEGVWSSIDAKNIICKFTYVKSEDALGKNEHNALMIADPAVNLRERMSTERKLLKWETERERYRLDRIDCVQKIADSFKKENEQNEEDEYVTIAKAIIAYWQSTLTKPFQAGPPIPPTMIALPGTYIPVYYGSEKRLANNLRRALNTGKSFKLPPTVQPATKLVATALAFTFASHLLELKFIYNGQIYVGTNTAPMIGFVPLVF